ncbi:MAG: tRNA pseudouridine(55) synthase TruB [Edaphobacter sp.]|uniref:tRNA pseudouridine(55) synthase TruB n=1 Tax=Edaphobacter sp. TaxID=1934404 RepID=UPI0023A180DA|nr:tRNA pseudouridine(55) synthase TruB [Edaphobacter sp.]MDE1175252.1 tRNA pseudouridine(55) synthase TruB [Edaphobacter sp.]
MNGLIVIDKAAGMTSHDVVSVVRRVTGERSIGHMGTLDPMATGVLPLLLGKYTRLAQFFGAAEKQYDGRIRFGYATDTYDAEGEAATPVRPLTQTLEELRSLAGRFHGDVDQMPPAYSAKKIDGVPAYKLARAGAEVPVKPARIRIHHFELTSLEGDEATFTMRVSAGGYVRSVAHELGEIAGCGAHLSSLRRTHAGPFSLAEAISMDALKELSAADVVARLPHPRTILPEMPAVTVDDQTAGRLRNGMQVNLPDFSSAPLIRIFTSPVDLMAIGRRVAGTLMQPIVVMG